MKTFGELLKAQRQKLGLTQKQVADSIGMSDAYICSLESDKKSPPPYYTVVAIANSLHMNVEQVWEVAVRYREKRVLEKIRRKAAARKKVHNNKVRDDFQNFSIALSDSKVNEFFARPEVQMSAYGLFHKQPEDMTIEEKRIIYQAITKAQECLDRVNGSADAQDSAK